MHVSREENKAAHLLTCDGRAYIGLKKLHRESNWQLFKICLTYFPCLFSEYSRSLPPPPTRHGGGGDVAAAAVESEEMEEGF
ncbi:hypothetical protein V6N13_140711 [Hibiscus sabdariffa]